MKVFLSNQVLKLDSCSSTQDAALEFALQQRNPNTLYWALSDSQSSGRGRQGRSWLNTQNALLCSVAYHWPSKPTLPTWISLVAGWALFEVLQEVSWAPGYKPFLKWPNDFFVGNGNQSYKLAGILCEHKASHLIVGWGLNLEAAPKNLPGSISLSQCSSSNCDRAYIFLRLQEILQKELLLILDSPEEYRPQLFDKLRRVAMKDFWNRPLQFRGHLAGKALDLKDDGSLRILDREGREHILHSGDVHLP